MLKSIKPRLFDAMSGKVAAFHEGFADISAILSALQLPSLRTAILSDTQGRLYTGSRLSRLAEQFRKRDPTCTARRGGARLSAQRSKLWGLSGSDHTAQAGPASS